MYEVQEYVMTQQQGTSQFKSCSTVKNYKGYNNVTFREWLTTLHQPIPKAFKMLIKISLSISLHILFSIQKNKVIFSGGVSQPTTYKKEVLS